MSNIFLQFFAFANAGQPISTAPITLSNPAVDNNYIASLGYNAPGDGGGAFWKFVSTPPTGHAAYVTSNTSAGPIQYWLYAGLIINPAIFGATIDGSNLSSTNTARIAALDAATALARPVVWPSDAIINCDNVMLADSNFGKQTMVGGWRVNSDKKPAFHILPDGGETIGTDVINTNGFKQSRLAFNCVFQAATSTGTTPADAPHQTGAWFNATTLNWDAHLLPNGPQRNNTGYLGRAFHRTHAQAGTTAGPGGHIFLQEAIAWSFIGQIAADNPSGRAGAIITTGQTDGTPNFISFPASPPASVPSSLVVTARQNGPKFFNMKIVINPATTTAAISEGVTRTIVSGALVTNYNMFVTPDLSMTTIQLIADYINLNSDLTAASITGLPTATLDGTRPLNLRMSGGSAGIGKVYAIQAIVDSSGQDLGNPDGDASDDPSVFNTAGININSSGAFPVQNGIFIKGDDSFSAGSWYNGLRVGGDNLSDYWYAYTYFPSGAASTTEPRRKAGRALFLEASSYLDGSTPPVQLSNRDAVAISHGQVGIGIPTPDFGEDPQRNGSGTPGAVSNRTFANLHIVGQWQVGSTAVTPVIRLESGPVGIGKAAVIEAWGANTTGEASWLGSIESRLTGGVDADFSTSTWRAATLTANWVVATPNGAAKVDRLIIGSGATGGGVYTPNATGGDQGQDTINAHKLAVDGVLILTGSTAPSLDAPVGSLYLNTAGGALTTLYVKTSAGSGAGKWTAK